MKLRFLYQAILVAVLLCQLSVCLGKEAPEPADPNRYLNAVREFADNVLKYGRDTYGPKHTPLFVDGLNVNTHKPVKWIAPNGDRWILSNLASQQNLFRTLDGLTRITGDPKNKQAAMDAIKYAFENLRSPNGLLYWGGHAAYDVGADRPCGRDVHELKGFYPYYELMWKVDAQATKEFIEAFWSGHIVDWSDLKMNRHSNMDKPLSKPWDYEYKGGPVFLKGGGQTFLCTGSDLICGAAFVTRLSGEKLPLVWAKRLAQRYVNTRHPNTGIGYGMYNLRGENVPDPHDDILRKMALVNTDFPVKSFPLYTEVNPIAFSCCRSYSMPTPEIVLFYDVAVWQSLLMVGDELGSEGRELKQWSLEELSAFGRASYRKKDNVFVPILTDGTNLEGYLVKEDGPLGPKGVVLKPFPAGASDFWAYAMSYRTTKNDYMWEMARNIALGNGFGDIGTTPGDVPNLNTVTNCSDPYAILAFLELNRAIGENEFVDMARRIGDNILANRFWKGLFVASNKHIYSKLDAIDSLALLRLYAAIVRGIYEIPEAWPNMSFFEHPYREKDQLPDNQIIYTLTESVEPPYSLQEAAAIGDLDLVKLLIEKGTNVDAVEDSFFKTALHRAVISGHKDVVEFLLSKGADVNDFSGTREATPLHWAIVNNRREIAELLIVKGANINTHNNAGQTPLDIAFSRDYKDIAELLLSKGADVDSIDNKGDTLLYRAIQNDQKDIVELLIDKGADINAKNNKGQTPLDIAISQNSMDIIELFISKNAISSLHIAVQLGAIASIKTFIENGTDINLKDDRGCTPLYYAVVHAKKDIVRLLVAEGADVNLMPKNNYSLLRLAVWNKDIDTVKLLVDKGLKADVKDIDGLTAFRVAALQGSRDIVEFFLSKGAQIPAFHLAACMGDVSQVKTFVEQKADINIKDEFGWTPLYWATSLGQTEVAKFLVSKGADVNAKDSSNRTPLHQAVVTGNEKLAELFIANSADINAKNNYGQTPLYTAVIMGQTSLVELLFKKGADLQSSTTRGQTLLSLGISRGNIEIVELLINNGADINSRDSYGQTPLHSAARVGDVNIVKLLISKGANINAMNKWNRTPLDLAKGFPEREKGFPEIAELLRKHGAKE